jgi:hypothetical protein
MTKSATREKDFKKIFLKSATSTTLKALLRPVGLVDTFHDRGLILLSIRTH